MNHQLDRTHCIAHDCSVLPARLPPPSNSFLRVVRRTPETTLWASPRRYLKNSHILGVHYSITRRTRAGGVCPRICVVPCSASLLHLLLFSGLAKELHYSGLRRDSLGRAGDDEALPRGRRSEFAVLPRPRLREEEEEVEAHIYFEKSTVRLREAST